MGLFDPKVYENGLGIPQTMGWLHRGVAYWRSGEDERVVILTAFGHMIALDAKTGMPVQVFGSNGWVVGPMHIATSLHARWSGQSTL